MKYFVRISLSFIAASIVLVGLWYIAVITFSIESYVLPSPTYVFQDIFNRNEFYATHMLVTFRTSIFGLLLGTTIGSILAVTAILIKSSKSTIEAIAVVARTLPIVAVAPIIMLWMGIGTLSQVVISALICFFPIFSGLLTGMSRADQTVVDLMSLYGATKIQTLFLLQLPSAVPHFVHSIRLASTLAVLGALVAEFTGNDTGLGSLVVRGLYRLDSTMLFSANVLSAFGGMLFYLCAIFSEIFFRRYISTTNIDETATFFD